MKESPTNKFDLLLSAAATKYIHDEAQALLSIEKRHYADATQHKRKIKRMCMHKRTPWQVFKIAAVACLVCLSVAFTACMCIPEVRTTIWNVVVEWYDDHMKVSFKPNETESATENQSAIGETTESTETDTEIESETDTITETETASGTETDEEVTNTPPNIIEKRVQFGYLPEGWYQADETLVNAYYFVNCYDESGTLNLCMTQAVSDGVDVFADYENDMTTRTDVNGNEALIIEYEDMGNVYSLIWYDGQYSYTIYGTFESLYTLIQIAKNTYLA